MTIFTAKVVADWDPQKPLTTTKLNQLYDNTQYNKDLIGSHLHTGLDGSARMNIGSNLIRNGDFESGLFGWISTPSATGSIAASASNADGAACVAITSTVLANGGGSIQSEEFIACAGGKAYAWALSYWASVANVSAQLVAVFFDNTQAQISTTTLLNSTNCPTANTLITGNVIPPANARYVQFELIGGVPGAGTAVGTVYFDSVFLTRSPSGALLRMSMITASNASWAPLAGTKMLLAILVGGGGGGDSVGYVGIQGNVKWGIISVSAATYSLTIGAGGAAGGGTGGGTGGTTSGFGLSATGGTSVSSNGPKFQGLFGAIGVANSGSGGLATGTAGSSGAIFIMEFA
jgi:hypothetical protein